MRLATSPAFFKLYDQGIAKADASPAEVLHRVLEILLLKRDALTNMDDERKDGIQLAYNELRHLDRTEFGITHMEFDQ